MESDLRKSLIWSILKRHNPPVYALILHESEDFICKIQVMYHDE